MSDEEDASDMSFVEADDPDEDDEPDEVDEEEVDAAWLSEDDAAENGEETEDSSSSGSEHDADDDQNYIRMPFQFFLAHNATSRMVESLPRLTDLTAAPPGGELAQQLERHTSALALTDGTSLASARSSSVGDPMLSPARAMALRETDATGRGFSEAAKAHLLGHHFLPKRRARSLDSTHSRVYTAQWAPKGDIFYAAIQGEGCIRVYDATRAGFPLVKEVIARQLRWTITDADLSPDGRYLAYSSINSTLHMVDIGDRGPSAPVRSVGNVTEVHEALELAGRRRDGDWDEEYANGVWSLRWSPAKTEILAGTSDCSVYIYDLTQGRTVARGGGHDDHVNAVCYADSTGNVFFSGSDDASIRVWDRRTMSMARRCRPVGVLVGHTDGLTHLDSKGDGRYLISNSKDQTIKMWDLRKATSPSEYDRRPRNDYPRFNWDYRWDAFPARGRLVQHPRDGSLATFRGHTVVHTLIRAYWSPAETTGQRFIYAGSADGIVRIWDVLTNQVVAKLKASGSRSEGSVVRDCSWHPSFPLLLAGTFSGNLAQFGPASGTLEL